MLKVAIVGCGKIADAHLSQIQRIPGCTVVAACDAEPLMAQQACERFHIPHACQSVAQMLAVARPDVVHITTPPQSHYPIARECLEGGCHVYVEKPFTVDAQEAVALVAFAEQKKLRLTVGHDLQFSHAMRRLRQLVKEGYTGGPPVHLESYYCYDMGDAVYARALLGNKNHWVRRLPGGLLQNVISHGIARIAEFMTTDAPDVVVHCSTSPLLRSIGENDIVDELRVIIAEQNGPTAYFTFSSQMRPSLNHFRLYGPANGLVLDEDEQSVLKMRGGRYKSYAEKFIPPVQHAREHLGSLSRNVRKFLARDFHMKAGMKCLIESFYQSITLGTPEPIPYREILCTARIMDKIFEQTNPASVASRRASVPPAAPEARTG